MNVINFNSKYYEREGQHFRDVNRAAGPRLQQEEEELAIGFACHFSD